MDSSTLLYLASFFFLLGAGVVALFWIIVTLVRGLTHKGNASPSPDQNLSVLARLLRDLQTQDLVVEMDGKSFRSASELSTAQLRRLGITASVLTKWLTPSTQTTPSPSTDLPSPVPTPEASAAFVLAVQPEPTIQPIPIAEAQPAAEADPLGLNQLPDLSEWIPAESAPLDMTNTHVPPFATEPTSQVKPVSTQLPDVVGGILNPAPTPAPVYMSIAMQINDILQARISGTLFDKRGLTVSDGPEHGVLVILDGKKYPGVKDVPDDGVRNLIRSCVMEWEKQSKSSTK